MKQKKTKKHVGLVHIGIREKSGIQIFEKLKQHEFKISQWDVLDSNTKPDGIDCVDVIVVNIGLAVFEYDDLLEDLFETNIHIIINEAVLTNKFTGVKRQSWERHLLNKIDPSISIFPENVKGDADKKILVDLSKIGITKTWILAASIGGPEAIQKFLSEFESKENYLFIIIQHIDKEFLPLMAQQFNQISQIKVDIPISGMNINIPSCIVYPTDENIEIDSNGVLELVAMNNVYAFSPCIDEACKNLAKNIKNINMAVFSGMSTDGIAGAKIIKESGGEIITQLESSCVLSSIVAGVKENVKINFEGTPIEMAQYIQNN